MDEDDDDDDEGNQTNDLGGGVHSLKKIHFFTTSIMQK
jgi:hypothetical protein